MTVKARVLLASSVLALLGAAAKAPTEFPAAIKEALVEGKSVYVASTRKDGTLGRAAPVWYMYHQGAVYVASKLTAWRVRRIKAGRPRVKMWVSKERTDFGRTREPDGPSFMASGTIVTDPKFVTAMLDRFGKKYPDTGRAEPSWEDVDAVFRAGMKDGSQVLIKYTAAE